MPVEMIVAPGYGRLDYLLALTLPQNNHFDITRQQLFILAHLTEAKGAEGDAANELVSYQKMGRSFVLDVKAVENVVGQVETKAVVSGGEYVIIDRSNSLCRTAFRSMKNRDADFDDDV